MSSKREERQHDSREAFVHGAGRSSGARGWGGRDRGDVRPSRTGAPPSCSASPASGSGFTTWFPPQGDGFAGGVGYVLEFSNTGTSVCKVDGFPKVTVTENGTQVGLKAATGGPAPAPVRLAVGQTAHAVLIVRDAGAVCQPHPTNGLKVQPAGATQPVTFPFASSACPGRSTMSVDRISFGTGIPSYTIS